MVFATAWQRCADLFQEDQPEIPGGGSVPIRRNPIRRKP